MMALAIFLTLSAGIALRQRARIVVADGHIVPGGGPLAVARTRGIRLARVEDTPPGTASRAGIPVQPFHREE
jgi:hypothetical protein